jgi:hypothetical protein
LSLRENYISQTLRREVEERAEHRCEYCLIPALLTYLSFHIDHIIPLKHDGPTVSLNLAFACNICNQKKGPNLATLVPGTRDLVRLFHPREDIWKDHFEMADSGLIVPSSKVGEATVRILELNAIERLQERGRLISAGIQLI